MQNLELHICITFKFIKLTCPFNMLKGFCSMPFVSDTLVFKLLNHFLTRFL